MRALFGYNRDTQVTVTCILVCISTYSYVERPQKKRQAWGARTSLRFATHGRGRSRAEAPHRARAIIDAREDARPCLHRHRCRHLPRAIFAPRSSKRACFWGQRRSSAGAPPPVHAAAVMITRMARLILVPSGVGRARGPHGRGHEKFSRRRATPRALVASVSSCTVIARACAVSTCDCREYVADKPASPSVGQRRNEYSHLVGSLFRISKYRRSALCRVSRDDMLFPDDNISPAVACGRNNQEAFTEVDVDEERRSAVVAQCLGIFITVNIVWLPSLSCNPRQMKSKSREITA